MRGAGLHGQVSFCSVLEFTDSTVAAEEADSLSKSGHVILSGCGRALLFVTPL